MITTIGTCQNLITNLLLNSPFMQGIGLMHGKTGIAITFYHLSRHTGNPVFEEFAGELLDDVTQNLTTGTSSDFETGLAGIGWGIGYLISKGFIDAEADEILDEVDSQLFRRFLEAPPSNAGLLTGVAGTGFYFLQRVQGININSDHFIWKTNLLAMRQIIEHIAKLVSCTQEWGIEPQVRQFRHTGQPMPPAAQGGPVFNILWEVPLLLRLLSATANLPGIENESRELVLKILKELSSGDRLPVLRENRLNLLLSLGTIQQAFQNNRDKGAEKIPELARQLTGKLYPWKGSIGEGTTDFSIQHGLAGKLQIFREFYEVAGDVSLKDESDILLDKLLSSGFIANYRFDYSNPGNAGGEELGLLRGIAGLLLVLLVPFHEYFVKY